jgi:hypothetical protein
MTSQEGWGIHRREGGGGGAARGLTGRMYGSHTTHEHEETSVPHEFGRPHTSLCAAPLGAMESEEGEFDDGQPASGPSGNGSFSAVRRLLAVGAAPLEDTWGDEAAARAATNPAALSAVKALLEAGPAAAVEGVEELYSVGLPQGLPGNLSTLAIVHRDELLQRTRELRGVHVKARQAVEAGGAAMRQGLLRYAGKYDRKRKRTDDTTAAPAAAAAPVGATARDEGRVDGPARDPAVAGVTVQAPRSCARRAH